MVHRLALTIGGLGAIGILGLALMVGGNPLAASGATATAQPGVEALVDDQLTASVADDPGVRTVVDTVYVRPADAASISDGRRNGGGPQATASPERASSPAPTSSPDPTASPEATFEAFDDHGGHGDDDRSGHRDGDDDHDRSGPGGGDDDDHDDDRSGHRDGDDDHDDDRSGHGGDDDHWDDD